MYGKLYRHHGHGHRERHHPLVQDKASIHDWQPIEEEIANKAAMAGVG